MTRIDLGGEGFPIPTEALPDGLTDTGLAPLTFTFNEDGSFDKTQWTPFGFTIFEIMCVGAAGGRGSFAWYMLGGGTNAPLMYFTSGGAGGGGGMHIVTGLLADLDDISDIIVGLAGVERDIVHPGYSSQPISYNGHGIDVGLPGGDGGYSSFADVCKASGGKGGDASEVVISTDGAARSGQWRPGGDGGEGGVGNSIIAGGGAAGGSKVLVLEGTGFVGAGTRQPEWDMSDAEQGFWDGTIGEGGGGGTGFTAGSSGVGSDAAWIPDVSNPGGFFIQSAHDMDSTNGGHGSFSYADSSKNGTKQAKPGKTVRTDFNPYNTRNINFVLPGAGGGARPTPLAKYGSYAAGYSPNGVVIVRIS